MSIDGRHRPVHLLGSHPAADPRSAMHEMIQAVGPYLRTLPDGETGERGEYVRCVVERLRANTAALAVVQDGDWSDLETRLVLRPRRGRALTGDDLDLHYAGYAEASWAHFEQITKDARRPDLTYQISVPTPMSMEFVAIGPAFRPQLRNLVRPVAARTGIGLFRNHRAFVDATVREVTAVAERLPPGRVICQLEATAELVLLTLAPAPVRPAIARTLADRIGDVVGRAPRHVRWGLHLCLGSMHNTPGARMSTTAPLVTLINALARAWPKRGGPEYIHGPIATSDRPAPVRDDFYRPLTRLTLPPRTLLHAGLVHEDQPMDAQRQVLRLVERYTGRTVGISAACGLGRRTPESARMVLGRSAALTRIEL